MFIMSEKELKKTDLVHPKPTCSALVANSLLRAAYSLSTIQKRILNVLFAQVQIRGKDFEPLEVKTGELARAIGVTDQNYEYIRAGIKNLMREVVDINTEEGWIMHHWVSTAKFIRKRDVFLFELHAEIMPYVLDFKKNFTRIDQQDLNKLQSKYALRIYDLVMANRGFKGDKGNDHNKWFTDLEFDTLRQLFKIADNEYKITANFRRKIIDYPVQEINEAHIGLHITTDYEKFRYGRKLLGVRLNCEWIGLETRVVNPATPSQRENEAWIEANPELYKKIRNGVTLLPGIPGDAEFFKDTQALMELKEHPKAVKPRKISKAKS